MQPGPALKTGGWIFVGKCSDRWRMRVRDRMTDLRRVVQRCWAGRTRHTPCMMQGTIASSVPCKLRTAMSGRKRFAGNVRTFIREHRICKNVRASEANTSTFHLVERHFCSNSKLSRGENARTYLSKYFALTIMMPLKGRRWPSWGSVLIAE